MTRANHQTTDTQDRINARRRLEARAENVIITVTLLSLLFAWVVSTIAIFAIVSGAM